MADIPIHKWDNVAYFPPTDLQIDVGKLAQRFNRGYFLNLSAGGLDYTWPTSGTAGHIAKLTSVAPYTIAWVDPAPSFLSIYKWGVDA